MTDLMVSVASVFWSFAYIFLVCDFGERVSAGFGESYAVLCTFDWYLYPIDIQRMLHIIMISVQSPVVFRSFGNIPCTREQAKKVGLDQIDTRFLR